MITKALINYEYFISDIFHIQFQFTIIFKTCAFGFVQAKFIVLLFVTVRRKYIMISAKSFNNH